MANQEQNLAGSSYKRDTGKPGPKLDIRDPGNFDQDYDHVIGRFKDMSADAWGGSRGRSMTDAQVVQASGCALTQVIAGFYAKPALSTFWAGGDHVTITDAGVMPGLDKAQWQMVGRRSSDVDDGITPANQSPTRAIGIAMETQEGRLFDIKHKIVITRRDIQRGDALGYDEFNLKGGELRKDHMQSINNVVRKGNAKYGIHGMVNYPGMRHRMATANWATDDAGVIYDDYNAAVNEIYVSRTEEPMPSYAVLARNEYRHIGTENFGAGTDTTLKTYIEDNNKGHAIYEDTGMAEADMLGGPGALFFTPRPDLVRVIAPEYMRVLPPHQENEETISITIVTRILGVVMTDVDTALFVDGDAAGWTSGF